MASDAATIGVRPVSPVHAGAATIARPRPSRSTWLGLGALLVVAIVVRAPRMNQSVWYDEYCRTHAVLNSERLADLLLHDVHNPLYNAFMYAWIGVFSDSALSIRTPSLIAGLASIVLFAAVLRRRAGAWVAWWFGAWAVLAPMHVWYSTEAKNNMFVLAFCTLAFWAVDRVTDRPTPGRTALAAAAVLAAFATDLASLLVIIPLLLWLTGEARRARSRPMFFAAAAIVGVLILGAAPWLAFKASNIHELWRGYLEPFRGRELAELLGGMFLTGHAYTPLRPDRTWLALGAMIFVLPLLVLGGVALWRTGRTRAPVVVLMLGLVAMLIAAAVVDALFEGSDKFIYQPRNLFCLFYVFGAVLWTGAARLRPGAIRSSVTVVLIAGTLGATALMLGAHAGRFTVDKPRSDWEAVAHAIATDAAHRGDTTPRAISASPALQIEIYEPAIDVVSTWGEPVNAQVLADLSAGEPVVYYVDDRDWWPAGENAIDSWEASHDIREIGSIDRVVVYAITRR